MVFPAVDDVTAYGGLLNNAAPVVDPTTHRDASDMNAALASVAAMTTTAGQAWARMITHATTPSLATSNAHGAAWGEDPSVAPTPTRTSTGIFVLTWPATVTNGIGDSHTVVFKRVKSQACEGTTAYHVQSAVTASNVLTIRVFDMAGTLTDAAGSTIHVELG
jgi:hypothetical protein